MNAQRLLSTTLLAGAVAALAIAAPWQSRQARTASPAHAPAASTANAHARGTARAPLLMTTQSGPGALAVAMALPAGMDPRAPATTEPPVPEPSTQCGISYLDDVPLDASNDYRIDFVPTQPAGCSNGWAKVILEIDYRFAEDRLPAPVALAMWIGDGANVFYGSVPTSDEGPAPWHVARDITDYATLLRRGPATGRLAIDPVFADAYPDVALRASFRLRFFAPTASERTPRKADAVFALSSPAGAMTALHLDEHHPEFPPTRLAKTLVLPRNVEHAFLDVLAMGVGQDALWWSCIPLHLYSDMPDIVRHYPNLYDHTVGGCLRGAFREAHVFVDGQPAGVAPVFPWLPPDAMNDSTGRIAAFAPAPPPRAFNLLPYRVDLSPFAGVLSDGAPHEIAVGIASSAPSIVMQATASLLVYRDPRSASVSGAITRNTLAGQSSLPVVTEALSETGGHVTGTVRTHQDRHFVLEGYADTARGRVRHRVVQTTYFDNLQAFDVLRNATDYSYRQDVQLASKTWRTSYKTLGTTQLRRDYDYFSTPLKVSDLTAFPLSAPGDGDQRLALSQGVHQQGVHDRAHVARYTTRLDETHDALFRTHSTDNSFDLYQVLGSQAFDFTDNRGSCYSAALATDEGALTDYTLGAHCGGSNHVRWYARPDGAPDALGWAGYD